MSCLKGEFKLNQSDFEQLMKDTKTLIVLDTNVILDLARYSLHTSENILRIFEQCKDLIWIPNQVIKEYNKNKTNVFSSLRKKYSKFENDLLNVIKTSERNFKSVLKNSERYKYFGNHNLSREISNLIKELRDLVLAYKDNIGMEYNEIIRNDPIIIKEIENFINSLKDNCQIGEKTSLEEQLNIIKEGELRYKYDIPPGYKDKNKPGIEKFGDLFLWKELLNLPNLRNKVNILFITNDEKEDWWQKLGDKEIAIREELLEEFKEKNPNKIIVFMTTGMFQKYASKFYGLYEFGVFVDLNRDDISFIKNINDKLIDSISAEIYRNQVYYLESDDFGGEGIEEVEVLDCEFIDIKNVYSDVINEEEIFITYELKYYISIEAISHEYMGRDDDTKDVILSPPIVHSFSGEIVISIDRVICKEDLDNIPMYLNKDDAYREFEIIETDIIQISIERYDDEYYDAEYELEWYTNNAF